MAGWHHWLDGRESEWTPGDGDEQGGLECCDPWGCRELDMTERLNWTPLWTSSPPCSSVHRFLKQEYRSRLPASFLKGSFWIRNQNHIFCGFCITDRFFNRWAIRVNPYSFVNKACPQRVLRKAINIQKLQMINYTSIDFKLSFLLIIKAVPLEYCHFSWWYWHRKYELL